MEKYLGQALELSKQLTFIELWQRIRGKKHGHNYLAHSPGDRQVTGIILSLLF